MPRFLGVLGLFGGFVLGLLWGWFVCWEGWAVMVFFNLKGFVVIIKRANYHE